VLTPNFLSQYDAKRQEQIVVICRNAHSNDGILPSALANVAKSLFMAISA
jgi:hypothetical protein